MTAILYPVAETAEQALHAPLGLAEREREAEALAGTAVAFRTELVGPAFPTREGALAAYGAGADGAPRRGGLAPVSAEDGRHPPPPSRPVYSGGRRWPEPAREAPILWRLMISYWRIGGQDAVCAPSEAARLARRRGDGRRFDAVALSALARQPLRPVRPQQPLDMGLFEVRRPEAPDVIMPDE